VVGGTKLLGWRPLVAGIVREPVLGALIFSAFSL